MKKSLTCIVCPIGCQLSVALKGEKVLSVTGNTCRRGEAYAKAECVNPCRVITTTVKTKAGLIVPVKTDKAIPKGQMIDAMTCINRLRPENTSFQVGDVICRNLLETGANVVVTASIEGR